MTDWSRLKTNMDLSTAAKFHAAMEPVVQKVTDKNKTLHFNICVVNLSVQYNYFDNIIFEMS